MLQAIFLPGYFLFHLRCLVIRSYNAVMYVNIKHIYNTVCMFYKSARNNNIAIVHSFVKEDGGSSDYSEYNFLKVNLRQDTKPKEHHGSAELPFPSILPPQRDCHRGWSAEPGILSPWFCVCSCHLCVNNKVTWKSRARLSRVSRHLRVINSHWDFHTYLQLQWRRDGA